MVGKILVYAVIAVVVIVGAFVALSATGKATAKYDGFAKCLTDKGATMYGASWCSHCANQKKTFGSSWQYVNYVECVGNEQACTDAGIQAYPTWTFGDGSKWTGELTLQQLSQLSGCALI